MSHSEGSTKVIFIALIANMGIALAKFLGAFLTGSASMLAEAIHSVVDCSNQLILLWGSKAARRSPDARHPLGYGKESFFWSFMVAIMLFSLGGMFSIYEGMHKLNESSVHLESLWISMAILILSIFLEAFSFLACLKEVKTINTHGSLWNWIQKSSHADLLVIFLEDAAALSGLVLATIFIGITWVTGNPFWDAAGSIVIGCLLIITAVVLGIEMKSLLIGEATSIDFQTEFTAEMKKQMPEASVMHFIALQIGGNQVMLSCKFHPGNLSISVSELINRMNALESWTKKRFPQVQWIFLEPDDQD